MTDATSISDASTPTPAVPAPPAAPNAPAPPTSGHPAPPSSDVERHLGLRNTDQIACIAFVTIACALLCVHWYRLGGGGLDPVDIERADPLPHAFQLDANTATWVEWMQLDGIGEALARRIVADRETNGPFKSVDDVTRVPGIGPKTLEQLRPWITVSPAGESPQSEPAN